MLFYVNWKVYDFTADDLIEQGEIGHGNYGTVDKMFHERSGTIMAVKVQFRSSREMDNILPLFFK